MNDLSNSPQNSDTRLRSTGKFYVTLCVCVGLAVIAVIAVSTAIHSDNVVASDSITGHPQPGKIPAQPPGPGGGLDDSPLPTDPAPSPLPSPAQPLQSEDFDSGTAETLLTSYFEYADAVTARSDQVADSRGVLDAIVGELLIDELEAQIRELQAEGWSRSGAPEVVSVEITDEVADSITAEVCLDSSAVHTRDFSGELLPESKTVRAINIFVFEQAEDQVWRIVAHRFPDDPAC